MESSFSKIERTVQRAPLSAPKLPSIAGPAPTFPETVHWL